jgi:CheY-like chemotaxis protein
MTRPTTRSVLVVDDDDGIAEALSDLLTDAGYDVQLAIHGQQALAMLQDRRDVGVILLDLTMPVMDGFEFHRRMRDDPRLRDIPVIVLTANLLDAHIQAMGVVACLSKTTPVAVLLDTLDRVLGPAAAAP